jgi:hypothetical protein
MPNTSLVGADYLEEFLEKKAHVLVISPKPTPRTGEAKFKHLAEEWLRETAFHSSLNKKVLHPAYQRIIGMGPVVIPMILQEMKVKPGHWFWALDALTQGASPADGCENLLDATNAWIKWGESKGYLNPEIP